MRSPLTAVELLVRIGDNGGLPVLNKVLARDDLDWHGANLLHFALEGGNADMVTKVFQKCSRTISAEELNWITVSGGEGAVQERVPSLLWLLHNITSRFSVRYPIDPHLDFLPALATLQKQFVDNGYDFSRTWRSSLETPPVVREPLLQYILRLDLVDRTHRLLQTLIQLDKLQRLVPITSVEGRSCLEHLLCVWNDCCLRIRKMLTGSEELEMLEELPVQLKRFVLRNEMD